MKETSTRRTGNSVAGTVLPLLASLAILPATSARAETTNCRAIIAAPVSITTPGVYCLRRDITTSIASGAAIDVLASNVTLDLNGFELSGLGAGSATDAVGIAATRRQNVTIRNGIVAGFRFGIRLDDDGTPQISQGHRVEDILAVQNTEAGVWIEGSGNVVRRNRVIDTGGSPLAIDAFGIAVLGRGNDVLDNRIAGLSAPASAIGIMFRSSSAGVARANRASDGSAPGGSIGVLVLDSTDVLVSDSFLAALDIGIEYSSSTGKYMNNLTSGIARPFEGGTPIGVND